MNSDPRDRWLLARFSAYGFLKNQRYFEPYLVLALAEAGAALHQIGLLIALRELVRYLVEIPSGVLADRWGRVRTMVLSFAVYPLGIATFALPATFALGGWAWALGMALLGVGDAFRSGTHKSIIFAWLSARGRLDERTQIYGYTRSWSKIGSAVSIPIGVAVVALSRSYTLTFWLTIGPWLLNLINLASYPRWLEGHPVPSKPSEPALPSGASRKERVESKSYRALVREVLGRARLRALLLDAMVFQSIHKAIKDYLAPAVLLVFVAGWSEAREVASTAGAVAIGAVYFVLHVSEATVSRNAHRLGEPRRALRRVGVAMTLALALVSLAGVGGAALAALGLLSLHLLQNAFRPLVVSEIAAESDDAVKSTVLSVESLLSSFGAIALAPLASYATERANALTAGASDASGLWALGATGLAFVGLRMVLGRLAQAR